MKRHRFVCAALLGAALLLLVPATSSAQISFGRGGYGRGGIAFSVGNAPYYRSYAGPGYYGFSPYYGRAAYPGYYAPRAYFDYSYPGYSSYWRGPRNYYTPSYYDSSYSSNPVYGYGGGTYTPGYRPDGDYAYGSTREANTATVSVRVPVADAEVWIEGRKTQQQGTTREFVSPPLDPGRSYTYTVRASWVENGKPVEQTRTVPVQANGTATADFTTGGGPRQKIDDQK
jgi:uncharacterized protein (TIGR03000 family)